MDARRCRQKPSACGSSPQDDDNLTEGRIPEQECGKIFRIGDLDDEDDDYDDRGDDERGMVPEYLDVEIFDDDDDDVRRSCFIDDILDRRRSSAMTKNSLIQNFQPESNGREIETESTNEWKIPLDRPNINVPFIILVDEEGAFAAIDCDPDDPDDADVIEGSGSGGGGYGDLRFCVSAADDNDVIVDVHRSIDDDDDDDADFMNSFAVDNRCRHDDESERRPLNNPTISFSPGITPSSVLASKETGCQGGAGEHGNGQESIGVAAVGEEMMKTKRRGTLVRSVGFDRGDDHVNDDDDDDDDNYNININNNCNKL